MNVPNRVSMTEPIHLPTSLRTIAKILRSSSAALLLLSTGVLCLGVLALAGPVSAQADRIRTDLTPKQANRQLDQWREDLVKIETMIVEGRKPKKVYKRATDLVDAMVERFRGDDEMIRRFLGVGLVLRAVAAHQLGELDEALWHWHVAQQIFPGFDDAMLDRFPETGPFFAAHPPRQVDALDPWPMIDEEKARSTIPKRSREVAPRIPQGEWGGIIEPVEVQIRARITVDGRVIKPTLVKTAGRLSLVVATLDAMRQWRYEPATWDGEPEEVEFFLVARFQIRR